jgi:hypothetical protein
MAGKLPRAGAELDLDTSAWDAAFKGAMADAAKLDALSPSVDVKVNVDDGEIATSLLTLTQLEDDASVKVNVDDSEVTTSLLTLDDLNEDASVKINVDDSEVDQSIALLQQIRNLAIIDIVLDIPQTAIDFVNKLPGVMALLGGQQGDNVLGAMGVEIEGSADVIGNLYVQFGLAHEEGARLIGVLSNMGVGDQNIEAAATSLLEAQTAIAGITGQAPGMEELLRITQDLQAQGITGSFQEGADLLVAIQQSGNAIGVDVTGDLNEFLGVMGTMGFTAEQVLGTINTGLSSGVDNVSRFAEGIISFNENASAGTDEFIAGIEAIDAAVGTDLTKTFADFQSGEVTGADFMASVLDGARTFAEQEGTTEATGILTGIFSSTTANIGAGALLAIDPNADEFTVLENRASEAATTIKDNLGSIMDEFVRTVNQTAADLLSSDAIDLDGKIEVLKTQLTTALETLGEGGSLGEAIEIGFGITGVDTALANVERVFGNLIIAVLEIVAAIQGVSGKDSGGTRTQIADMGQSQLEFDLQIANPEEFQSLIDTAVSRGVDQETLSETVRTALDTLAAEGNFDQVIGLVDQIISSEGITPENIQLFKDKYITPLSDEMNAAITNGDFDLAKKISDAQGDPTAYTDALKGKFGFDAAAFDQMALDFAAGMETAIIAENPTAEQWFEGFKPTPEVTTAVTAFAADIDTALTNANLVTGLASQEMINAFSAITDGVTTADEQIAMAITGNTMTASFDAMSMSAEQNVEATKLSFKGLLATVSQVDVAMSAFFNGIMAKVSAVNSAIEGIGTVPTTGGGGGNTTNNTVVVNQTNNVQGNAEGMQPGYQIARAIRGMG